MTKQQAIEKLVQLAAAQLGYCEKDANANLDGSGVGHKNWTKYARDLDAIEYFNGGKNGFDWCATFVHWLFVQTFGKDLAQKMLCCGARSAAAMCRYGRNYFRDAGRIYTRPEVGDQAFFGNESNLYHTGLVVGVSGDTVTVIEGNKGDRVQRCPYSISGGTIGFYGRPRWELVADEDAPIADDIDTPGGVQVCDVTLPVLKQGSSGGYVKTLQILLKAYGGYEIGADGVFGSYTDTVVRKYQRARGLAVDGVVGKQSWSTLLK